MSVGIERMRVYVPSWAMFVADLAEARGLDPAEIAARIGTRALAVAPPCEDVVTMAATAGARLLRDGAVDPREVGLLVVATGAGVDRQKPAAVWVHEMLGIGPACRTFDVKHAGYGGTAAVMLAADWIRAARGRARRALVIGVHAGRAAAGSLAECAHGAAAVAMLIGVEPRALILGEDTGMWAREIDDAWWPLGAPASIVDVDGVSMAYLAAVAGAFGAFRPLEHPEPVGEEVVTDRLARIVLQLPYPAIARAAYRQLVELDWRANDRRWAVEAPRLESALEVAFAEQVHPATLRAVESAGDTGAAGLWLGLAALVEAEGRRLGGRRLGMFAWGAGDGAEFFTGLVPVTVGAVADTGLARALERRRAIDVATWDTARAAGDAGGEPPEGFDGEFVLTGVEHGRRSYRRVA